MGERYELQIYENIRKNKPDKGLVNIKQYLTENEISELYKLAMYSKIQLVLIEFNMYGKKSEYENIYIIDKDSCIITYQIINKCFALIL